MTVLTYCGQFLAVSICQYVTKSISKFRRNVNIILFSRYRRENGGHTSRPGCVNTLWQRQSDPYFEDNIFNFICNFRWNLNKTSKFTYLKWQSCFGCNALRARQNGAPFKMIYSNNFSCMELLHYFFFKFDLSVFLNFHTEIYCIILTSCSERGSNTVHRIWRH